MSWVGYLGLLFVLVLIVVYLVFVFDRVIKVKCELLICVFNIKIFGKVKMLDVEIVEYIK